MNNSTKLSYINTILKQQNLTKAAKKLYISQPYLSKIIKNIEEELGVQIFYKNKNIIKLTFAGERYIHYLKQINKIENKLYNEISLIKTNKKGKVKLGINSALATAFLYKVIPEFNKNNPDVIIELIEKNQNISEYMLIENDLDLVIGMSPIANKNLSYNTLYSEKLYLFIPKKHHLYNPKVKNISKFNKPLYILNNEPIVTTPEKYGIGHTLKIFFEKNNIELNTAITTSTVPTAVNLAKSGIGMTFIPETIVDDYINEECNIYYFNKSDIKAEYVAIYRKDELLSEVTTNLLNIILETLKK
ncbi:LysR family transcriptional regulator [Gemella sp. GH3]|uniref:LysR family transcriptional regulator n=1 Tax=unclassified Gemella TaxID=2624949 RepID=UPI0015D08ABE|nr:MULTISPECIES: LysR family transcriptional regulator [unclassified Gemella]MBF0713629.1 LysR family transcriptional regulator [Gemella sp. GH3.1]NYS50581.1 LysR family transcriptional regulator [Gemella sp. GH3]